MNATLTEELVAVAQLWRSAPHGRKSEVLARACERLQMARATLHRHLKAVAVTPVRKQRSDAGQMLLSMDDAKFISAVLMEHMRKNGKQLKSTSDAVAMLRANGVIRANRVDAQTGECISLSNSAILRALRQYRLHPAQLLAPPPAISLRSLHPNHVWQIDASRCVLYYLPRQHQDNGLRIADHREFYKNKPANLQRAERDALWRYVATDHTSGAIYAAYVIGGETGENLADFFIGAMCQREGETLYGVPAMVMLDPGSPNTGAVFRNLCQALRVRVQINQPGNPRAKGQVEKAQDIVERSFESTLKLLAPDQVQTLDQINALCAKWRRWFNGTHIHSRHGQTRDAAWLHITPEQLILAPSANLLRELAVSEPQSRVVSVMLRVNFAGAEYDASSVPGVCVGEKLMICRNPWRSDSVQAVGIGQDGYPIYHVLDRVVRDDFGQVATAPVIGQDYARHADTPVQTNLKALERLATGAQTEEDAQAFRKRKGVPFGGKLDPFKHIDDAQVPANLPRRGTDHDLVAPSVQLPLLTHIQAAKQLKRAFPEWSTAHYAWLQDRYPNGVPVDALEQVSADLANAMPAPTAPAAAQPMRIVRAA